MAITRIPQCYLPKEAVFLPAYREAQIPASSTAAVIAHWIVPFDCEFIKLDYRLTVAGATHTTDNFDILVDGSSIMAANIDTMDTATTYTSSVLCDKGATSVPPAKAALAAGSIVTVVITTSANSTVDDMALCLVVKPRTGV